MIVAIVIIKMNKTRDLFIETNKGKSLKNFKKWGNHVHYFKVEKVTFIILKVGNMLTCRGMQLMQVGEVA